ncbi:MAG TPA: hypothetical protein DEA88_16855 [Erwinia persicina]|uniref:Uncharacterized protein n=1 Tax=Erwinia persicina TaxID=55211 RepID=A0A4U3F178_9GAMM|nr:hypothetical protein EpCFBP13511_17950 [Erwinia persicina]HBI08028.1 hypothetical protein [Erwinia persicina]HBT14852.1 hypothetical protein [Erwinia persicina]
MSINLAYGGKKMRFRLIKSRLFTTEKQLWQRVKKKQTIQKIKICTILKADLLTSLKIGFKNILTMFF